MCGWWHGRPRGRRVWLRLGIGLVLSLMPGTDRGKVAAPAVPPGIASALVAGQPAPDFVTQTIQGMPVALQNYRGRPVVLNFWATWCAPCRQELPILQAAYEAYREK